MGHIRSRSPPRSPPRHAASHGPKSAREGGRVREGGSGAQIAVFLMPDSSCTIVVPPAPRPSPRRGAGMSIVGLSGPYLL